jgi:hypothetical protein
MEQVTSHGFGGPRHRLRRLPGRRAILICQLAALLIGLALPRCIAAEQATEYQIKAVFLLNFTKFIDWPPAAFTDSEAPIAVCILGDDPFGNSLDQTLEGELVNGRKMTTQRIKRAPPPKACQVLFVGRSEKELSKTLSGLGAGVLTVGEGESFVRAGGMIAFVIEDRRVRFEINRRVAENAGLKLSSKLLNVAKSVE